MDDNGILQDFTSMPAGRLPLGVEVAACPRCGRNGRRVVSTSRTLGGKSLATYIHVQRIHKSGQAIMLDFHAVPVDTELAGVQGELF